MLLPQVIGFKLTGELREGRRHRPGAHRHRDAARARCGREVRRVLRAGISGPGSPTGRRSGTCRLEFGSTCAIFPIDAETLRYLEFTGRPTEQIELVDAYTREQGLFHEADSEEPTFSDTLELDLGDVEPSIAGPKRPRTGSRSPTPRTPSWAGMQEWDPEAGEELGNMRDQAIAESFPASDLPAEDHDGDGGKPAAPA